MANPYKKKLATASLVEAQAMDKAYSTALANKQKSYTQGGLEYAVQPGKTRVYATDIVKARTPKPTTPAAPIVSKPITPTKPAAPVQQKPVTTIPTKSTGFEQTVPSWTKTTPKSNYKVPSEKLNASTLGGVRDTTFNYAASPVKAKNPNPTATTWSPRGNPFKPSEFKGKPVTKSIAKPTSTLATDTLPTNRPKGTYSGSESTEQSNLHGGKGLLPIELAHKSVNNKYYKTGTDEYNTWKTTLDKYDPDKSIGVYGTGNPHGTYTKDENNDPLINKTHIVTKNKPVTQTKPEINNEEEGFFDKALKAVGSIDTIKQAARKYGLIDDAEKADLKIGATPTVKKEIPKNANYKLESTRDTAVYPITQSPSNPANWSINENNPDIKARYSYVGNRAERIAGGTKDIPNAKVVSDFLLDESFESGYKHPYAQNFHKNLKAEPNRIVSVSVPDKQGTYTTVVKPYGELTPEEKSKGKIKQTRNITLSELENSGTVKGDKIYLHENSPFKVRGIIRPEFPIPGEPDTRGKNVPLSAQDKLGAFSGGAVTISYKDKDGKHKSERLNGSINQIIGRAREIKNTYGSDPTMMLADVGSFSNKPYTGKGNVLTAAQQNQVNSYNTDDYGGAMEVLRADQAKAYKFKGLNGARDTTVITSDPNNKFVKKFAKNTKKNYATGGNLPEMWNGGYTGAQLDRTQYGFGPTSMANPVAGGQFQNSGGFGQYVQSGYKDPLTGMPEAASTGQTAAGATGTTGAATGAKGGISNAAAGAGLQAGAQLIGAVDGMDGRPSKLGGVAAGAMSGASMGMAFGPWGAAAGAAVGGGLALIQAEKAKKEEAKAKETYMKNLTDQNNFTSQQTLRNYASQGVNTSGSYAYGGDLPEYGKGGKIHIKKENRGKFTAYKKRTGKTTEEALHSKDPHVRKMANFARNAKKWHHGGKKKHGDGGKLYAYPYGGPVEPEYEVEEGEMVQGQPVLEEGQQVASDMYAVGGERHEDGGTDGAGGDRVFSDRLKTANKKTYAEEAEQLAKQKAKFEAKIPSTNEAIRNTGERMSERMDMKLDELFNEQEMKKMYAMPSSISSSFPKMWDGGTNPRFRQQTNINALPLKAGLYNSATNRRGAYGQYAESLAGLNTGQSKLYRVGDPNMPLNYQSLNVPILSTLAKDKSGASTDYQYSGEDVMQPLAMRNTTLPSTIGPGKLPVPNMLPVPTNTGTGAGVGGATGKAKRDGSGIPWQYVDNLASGIATANTPELAKPYMDPRVNLNTEFDINPQLSSARNTRDAINRSIGASTPQGGASSANRQQLFASSVENENSLYAQKNNIENELKNKEILLNSNINSRNNDKRYAYDEQNVLRRAGIQEDIVDNAKNFAVDQYTSARDAKMDARDLESIKQIAMANPNGANYGYDLKAFADVYANDPAKLDAAISQMQAISPNAPALQYLINMRKNLTGK